jgi:hypothetical protein
MKNTNSTMEDDHGELWRQPAPGRKKPSQSNTDELLQADLDIQGWSKVIIPGISREPIIIAYSKHQPGIPTGYGVYTTAELERIGKIKSPHTIRLIHAAIKMGAELITK